jgi:hypothetical protein
MNSHHGRIKTMKTHFLKLLSLVGVLLITAVASAQNYTLESSSIGDGGGTSTGDGYSLSGGISLTGAGQLSGGGYTMDAGFWSIPPAGAPTPIFDNIGGSANGGSGVTATAWLASRFCLGSQSYQLASVSLLLNSQDFSGGAGPPAVVQLQIYASDPVTGKPSTNTGLIMNLSSHTNPVALVRGQQLVRWTNATPFTLVADTCYWAVLSRESGGRIGQIASFTKPTGDAGSFGASSSANAGATWGTPTEASNNKMLVQGIAITAPPPFIITSVSLADGELSLSFAGSVGQSYVVESRPEVAAGEWVIVPGSTQVGTGVALEVSLSLPASQPQQFFRVRQLP